METQKAGKSVAPNILVKKKKKLVKNKFMGFPGGAVVKNPPANAGDMGSSPGPGTSHLLQSN